MTSALQILYIWRSPARRSQDLGGAGENDQSDPEPDFCHRQRDNHYGHRRGDVDPSRRSYAGASKGRHPESCSSRKERELGRSVSNRSDYFCPGNSNNGGVSSSRLSRLGLIKNDQLPGAVLEARKRLIERLGGVSLTEIRQADVLRVNHSSLDQNVPMHRTNPKTPYCDSASIQTEQDLPFHISNRQKPPTEIRGAFFALKSEFFKTSKGKDGGELMAELPDCCICLEKFEDGDKLIRLRCNHKFHPYCFEPWLRSNGNCPYCRRNI